MAQPTAPLLISVLLIGAIFGSAPAVASLSSDAATQGPIDPDSVLLRVSVEADGDATWAITYRVKLDDANETEAFESVRKEIETEPEQYSRQFIERIEPTVASAQNTTGRSMAIRNVSVSAHRQQVPQEYGVITYRFEWTGFAAVEADKIHIGDAIRGFFLDRETRLIVQWPSEYELLSVSPSPDERSKTSVSWTGRHDFSAVDPQIVVGPASATNSAGDEAGETGTTPTKPVFDSPVALSVGTLGVLALAVGGAILYKRNKADDEGDSPVSDDRLLSNEERVVTLLEANDGRLKQQQIATEFGWTGAKTSQTIGELREQGTVETFRLGRENVVTLVEDEESI